MDGLDINLLVGFLSAAFTGGVVVATRAIAARKTQTPPPPPKKETTGSFNIAGGGADAEKLAVALFEVLERVRTLHAQSVSLSQDRAKDMINKERMAHAMENLTNMSIIVEEIRDELFRTSGRLETRIEDAVEALREEIDSLRADLQPLLDATNDAG